MNLSIKNVPEETVARLRERAKRNHRSIQGELTAILEDALMQSRLSIEELRRQVQSLGLHTADESGAMIREDRDAR